MNEKKSKESEPNVSKMTNDFIKVSSRKILDKLGKTLKIKIENEYYVAKIFPIQKLPFINKYRELHEKIPKHLMKIHKWDLSEDQKELVLWTDFYETDMTCLNKIFEKEKEFITKLSKMVRDIVNVLKHFKEKGITTHINLKPENIFTKDWENFILGDTGFLMDEDLRNIHLTPEYIGKSQNLKHIPEFKSDDIEKMNVFGLGLQMLYQLDSENFNSVKWNAENKGQNLNNKIKKFIGGIVVHSFIRMFKIHARIAIYIR